MYSLRRKLYTNYTLNYTQQPYIERQRDKESKSQRDKGRKDRLFETLMFMNYSRIDHELIF